MFNLCYLFDIGLLHVILSPFVATGIQLDHLLMLLYCTYIVTGTMLTPVIYELCR